MSALLLGEALVDLVCERPATELAQADAFVPHPGGAMANAAVVAARHGGDVALAGGAGDDAWGRWLRERLAAEGVDLSAFVLAPADPTPVAFVTVDAEGEPTFHTHGAGLHGAIASGADRVLGVLEEADGFVFASNTLVEEDERDVTLAARDRARELGLPVVFDPNLRPGRWEHPGRATTVARSCLEGLFLLKCNRAEATLLSGEEEPEAAAAGLLAAGVQHVLVTLGAQGGAILRGQVKATVAAPVVPRVVDATGAGDAVLGVVLARLTQTGFYGPAIAAALPEALAEAARTVGRWGAVAPRGA